MFTSHKSLNEMKSNSDKLEQQGVYWPVVLRAGPKDCDLVVRSVFAAVRVSVLLGDGFAVPEGSTSSSVWWCGRESVSPPAPMGREPEGWKRSVCACTSCDWQFRKAKGTGKEPLPMGGFVITGS